MDTYPSYARYDEKKNTPSVLDNDFPVLDASFEAGDKVFYPRNPLLEHCFPSALHSLRFSAACFCGFLHDTIAVEHNLVIPAISSAGYLPFTIPPQVLEDLYQLVTDEGHHAAQAEVFLNSIASRYDIEIHETENTMPRFLRRLNEIKTQLDEDVDMLLCDVVAGVVTETRISIELSQFSRNDDLVDPVRDTCRSHQDDEAIHASQFRALGRWMWDNISIEKRSLVAELFAKIIIIRSIPDVDRLAFYLYQTTNLTRQRCKAVIGEIYTQDLLKEEMLIAAKPTIRFLEAVGIADLDGFRHTYENYDYAIDLASR